LGDGSGNPRKSERVYTTERTTPPSTRSAGLTKSLDLNGKQQDTLNTRLADTEARMRAQYTALDTKMATLNGLSTYITQQIAQWNKNTPN